MPETPPRSVKTPLDCLAIIRAPLEQFPPSLNQVALLAEAGLRVAVLDVRHPDFPLHDFGDAWASDGHGVRRFDGGPHTQFFKERTPRAPVRLVRAWRFHRAARRLISRFRPRVVMTYDPYAMHAAGKVWEGTRLPRARLVWHFHEHFRSPQDCRGLLTRGAAAFCARWAGRADEIIFPDRMRAMHFARAAGLSRVPAVVFNCPRRLDALPPGALRSKLVTAAAAAGTPALAAADSPILYFHGWIGPHCCLEEVIAALPACPQKPLLVLVGPVSDAYRRRLETAAAQAAVRDRVAFLGLVPLPDLPSLAAGADLGLSLFPARTGDLNLRYLAGASNKRFQYMASGLAQVANPGPGMDEIIETPGCGLLLDPAEPAQLVAGLRRLLGDPPLRAGMNQRARAAHLAAFNYEHQFASVLGQVLKWCSEA